MCSLRSKITAIGGSCHEFFLNTFSKSRLDLPSRAGREALWPVFNLFKRFTDGFVANPRSTGVDKCMKARCDSCVQSQSYPWKENSIDAAGERFSRWLWIRHPVQSLSVPWSLWPSAWPRPLMAIDCTSFQCLNYFSSSLVSSNALFEGEAVKATFLAAPMLVAMKTERLVSAGFAETVRGTSTIMISCDFHECTEAHRKQSKTMYRRRLPISKVIKCVVDEI